MDLGSLSVKRAEAGATLHLRHPVTDEPLVDADGSPVTFQIIGQDAGEWRRRRNALIEKRPSGKIPAAYFESEALEMSVACIVDWSGNIEIDGRKFAECTESNVRQVLALLPWAREQVDAFNADRANFLKDSPTT